MQRLLIIFTTLLILISLNGCSYIEKDISVNNETDDLNEEDLQHDESYSDENIESEDTEEDENKITLKAKYFNVIEEVSGNATIQNTDNHLILVNKQFFLPEGYEPPDLVRPDVLFSFGDEDIEKSYLREKAAKGLERMFQAAKEEQNLHLFAVSGYRSYERQVQILNAKIASSGEEEAVQVIATPGQSEHQTGLAMDISSESAGFTLTEQFEETDEGKWLANNAHRFGFILRYPKGKESVTGFAYEPWHFRYVGKEAATVIFENDLTLEEYFEIATKI